MTENTLFYSKYCKHCRDFIIKLKQRDLLNIFTTKICIDDPRIKNNLPPFLKEVPTILVDDYDKPLASDMAFKWIEFKKKQIVEEQTGGKGIQDYDISGGSFDNAGLLNDGDNSIAYQGLGDSSTLKKNGGSSVMYQETLLPPDMIAASIADGNKGDNSKRMEQLQMARSMDDEMSKNDSRGGAPSGMPMAYNPNIM